MNFVAYPRAQDVHGIAGGSVVAPMGIEFLFLILAVLVVVFGIGVIVVSRAATPAGDGAAPRTTGRPVDPAAPSVPSQAPARGRGTPVEAGPVEPGRRARSRRSSPARRLRDRLAKARSAFTGAFAGVLGRGAINDDTFDDLEEALLRADVGVGVTEELIDGLRTQGRREGDHRAAAAARRAAGAR